MLRTIEIPGDQIDVHADIGPGRIVSATLVIEEPPPPASPPSAPDRLTLAQWEKELDELLALSPENPYPVDDSREAMYGPDPEDLQEPS